MASKPPSFWLLARPPSSHPSVIAIRNISAIASRAPAALLDRNMHPRPVRFDPDTRRSRAPTSIMKNRPKNTVRLASPDKIKALKLKIAAAEKSIAASRRRARAAKASFKRARKTFKQAKKAGKAARRRLETLREALSQAEQAARKSPAIRRKKARARPARPHVAAKPAPRPVAVRARKPAPQRRPRKKRTAPRPPVPRRSVPVEPANEPPVIAVPVATAPATPAPTAPGDSHDPLPAALPGLATPPPEPPAS